ncbi:MAG: hypothetical protein RJB26_2366 [Pseudomonadota bacterium]
MAARKSTKAPSSEGGSVERGARRAVKRPPTTDVARTEPGDRRAEIIAATLRVIGQTGISGATMRGIAREMGLTTGVISHYFRDKNELLQEALQTCFDPWTSTLEHDGADNSWQRLCQLFLIQLDSTCARRDVRTRGRTWLSLLVQIDKEEGLWQTYRDRYELIRQQITALIRQCQQEGFIQAALDPVLECDRLLALTDGLTISVVGEPDHFSVSLVNRILSTHLESLKAQPSI